ncbi:hypothetical protein KIN20_029129 [Parelaphostrongylus tenuis]|uniref:Uncharacterized protein n=1 Tax=Parelaphostrongylus tenuis TaxID=148309 RepID=A0AAD5R214_PARTN|nr:hypothetical protein KIN20_029129 [Parelaphostrongylus tenuis]
MDDNNINNEEKNTNEAHNQRIHVEVVPRVPAVFGYYDNLDHISYQGSFVANFSVEQALSIKLLIQKLTRFIQNQKNSEF